MNMYPIINRHAAWLVVNPIQGCPNNCRYCFLQSAKGTRIKPITLCEPAEVVQQINSSPFYVDDVPLCLFSQTDIFSTKSNIKYLGELFDEIEKSEIRNPLVLITKCRIPLEMIARIKGLQKTGHTIVVYLSYSGLDVSIEQGIDAVSIKQNFRNLYESGIPIIHYFRPIIPVNGTFEKIDEIIRFVSNYSKASVVAGLKVEEAYIDNLDFWKEVMSDKDVINAECVWPSGARQYLREVAQQYNYPIFETNACALSYILNGKADRYGFYGTDMCTAFNCCPPEHRARCAEEYVMPNIIYLQNEINSLLNKMHISDNCQCYLENNMLIIDGVPLSVEETCFLSGELHVRVDSRIKKEGYYWNTSINNKTGIQR